MKKLLITALPLCFVLASCSSTGPAEDSWDDEFKDTPRFDFFEKFGKAQQAGGAAGNNQNAGAPNYNYSNGSYDVPAIDQKSFEEFEAFKAWRRVRQPGSAEFQEYQDWQAYQQYRRFKTQQQQPAAAENDTAPAK